MPLGEQLDEGLDRDQRVADLVGDLGDERTEGCEAIERPRFGGGTSFVTLLRLGQKASSRRRS